MNTVTVEFTVTCDRDAEHIRAIVETAIRGALRHLGMEVQGRPDCTCEPGDVSACPACMAAIQAKYGEEIPFHD